MAKMKYKYYLATVCGNGRLQYVTGIQQKGHWFFRDAGKPAMEFTKTVADDIHWGMVLNMFDAVIVKMPAFFTRRAIRQKITKKAKRISAL